MECPTPWGAGTPQSAALVYVWLPKAGFDFFVQGAYEQYKLPYTIMRPFYCVGIGGGLGLAPNEKLQGTQNQISSGAW